MVDPVKRTVAIAGASGFVGRALAAKLSRTHDVIGLARQAGDDPHVTWRTADLFNLRDAERALEGADVAVYLVHSMMPSARLTQASFEDLDLLCADNFARAARKNGVGHIVYLGGLLPPRARKLSRHLRSRREVEAALAAHGVPVTTLRAGLVIGPGGSSFDMMARLVERLPLMLAPRWTRSRTQPIALDDAVALLAYAVEHPDLAGKAHDIGGPDVLTYVDMLRLTAEAIGKQPRILPVPVGTPKLSLLWVSAITGAPQSLVRPLVESLHHDMVATDGLALQQRAGVEARPVAAALAEALEAERTREPSAAPARPARPDARAFSVQRLPGGKTAADVATAYTAWLPRFLRPFLHVSVDENRHCRFYLRPLRRPLLELTFSAERSTPDRQLFYVTGGLLAGEPGHARPRLEFRSVLGGESVLAAVHDFVPSLPWFAYASTQALVHLGVMRAFGRHLRAR